MEHRQHLPFALLVLLLVSACGTYKHAHFHVEEQAESAQLNPNTEILQTLYLVGDAGSQEHLKNHEEPLFEHLRKELAAANEKSSIVFLGDNIYPAGLPKSSDKDRSDAEFILDEQLELVREFKGEPYFIPGNHDWRRMKSGGLKAVKRQEKYVQKYFEDERVRFFPNDGCGDPVVKKAGKDLYYVFIDTQWWLHDWEKEWDINKGCEIKSRQEFLQNLSEIFLKHKNDQIVVMLHHPLFSNGEHGGHFSPKTHLFPLTHLNKNLYVPLPILGSLMPFERKLGGNRQDIPHPLYSQLRDEILDMLDQNKHVIFASGHEHSLQYFVNDNSNITNNSHHFIVSGSGSKVTYAKRGGDARMVRSAKGYCKLEFYKDGEVWAQFIKVDDETPDGEVFFKKRLVEPQAGTVLVDKEYPKGAELEARKLFAANPKFEAHGLKQGLLGKQYRQMWVTPVDVPVVRLDSEMGGLTPIKKGGGMASNSLRLERDSDGYHYAMRSVLKDYRKLVTAQMSSLSAIDIFQDLNSASHPYGALVIPELSKAANIYYTKPKLVYLQRHERLGLYNELFNEELYLLEDRPAGDRSKDDHLGNSSEIISYLDLLELQRKDNHIEIDQEWTLRSRLFDLFIHDWDRHDDQWRWGRYEVNGKDVYRPIPRDRDQAFYKFDGFVPWLVGAFAVRKFKGFKDDLIDVKWQSFNARYFDRYFLNEMEWKDWEEQIRFLQENLTDEVIAAGAKNLPPEVYADSHEELEMKLRSRRDNLLKIGRKLYDHITKEVSIVGSNEAERFEVERQENGDVKVQVFDLNKKHKKKKKLFERTFLRKETKEIRLYGLDGKDEFRIKGVSKRSIKVRVIGGFGKDELRDASRVSGLDRKTVVYDERNGIKIKSLGETKNLTGPEIEENDYDRKGYRYNTTTFAPFAGSSQDNRFWFGLTTTNIRHKFRKDPYWLKHTYKLDISPSERFYFRATYDADFKEAIMRFLDFNTGVYIEQPSYVNYFGLGNNTVKTSDDLRFNWVRIENLKAKAHLKKTMLSERITMYAGVEVDSWSVPNDPGAALSEPSIAPPSDQLKRRNYYGAAAGMKLEVIDNKNFPKEGFMIGANARSLNEFELDEDVSFLDAESRAYITFGNKFATTLALRAGWQKATGDLQFYQYPSMGFNNYLRGYRNDRFRGEELVYYNGDIRLRLGKTDNRILPFEFGLIGGGDIGRVWLDGDSPGNYHTSVTGGVWMNILGLVVIQPAVSVSEEETQINFSFGFSF